MDPASRFEFREESSGPLDVSRYPHFSHINEEPGSGDLTFPYGIVLQPTFDPDWLWAVRGQIESSNAEHVLIIASEFIEPLVRPLVHDGPYFEGSGARIDIAVAKNEAFLGGDVVPGDLLVADDFTACIQRQAPPPDLVLIPTTPFGRWGRDISRKSYLKVEGATGVRVELMACETISAI